MKYIEIAINDDFTESKQIRLNAIKKHIIIPVIKKAEAKDCSMIKYDLNTLQPKI